MKISLIPLAVLLVISGIALADDGDAPQGPARQVQDHDQAKRRRRGGPADKDRTVFDVKSPFGISQAVIERADDEWPKAVVLRLHLKGLENFRASNGKVTLDAAVSSQGGQDEGAHVEGRQGGRSRWTRKARFWTDIRIVGGDGKPAKEIPLKDGYFEMTLPQGVLRGQPEVDHPELDRLLQELTETQ